VILQKIIAKQLLILPEYIYFTVSLLKALLTQRRFVIHFKKSL